MNPDTANVQVGFATRGRPQVLSAVIGELSRQTVRPSGIIVSYSEDGDVPPDVRAGVIRLKGGTGLTRQRNAIMRSLPSGTEFLVFFDDDFVPHPTWIERGVDLFRRHPDVAAITGTVILDGIKGPGIPFETAKAAVDAAEDPGAVDDMVDRGPYGCNMMFRVSAIEGLTFDERLVLYGWQEDVDFGAKVRQRGRTVRARSMIGVHMGTKKGRVSGRRLGYSQVINPVYLYRRGTMSRGEMVAQVSRNITANLAGVFRPEPYVDRRGRLLGNLIGFKDLFSAQCKPENAENL